MPVPQGEHDCQQHFLCQVACGFGIARSHAHQKRDSVREHANKRPSGPTTIDMGRLRGMLADLVFLWDQIAINPDLPSILTASSPERGTP